MKRIISFGSFALAAGLVTLPAQAEQHGNTFVGTIVARDMMGLSYEAGGCIVAVNETARASGSAKAGQILVELDGKAADLALETAKARVADLEAAVAERQLAVDAAQANVERRSQDLALVRKEFERNEQIFRRGLLNESAMEAVESKLLNATFASDQAGETLASALSAKTRAEISLRIGHLDVQARVDDVEDLTLRAPFDGVLLGFEPNVGDCVQARTPSAQIYAPANKSVEVFVRVDQLVTAQASGVAIGAPVSIERINGEACGGAFTWIGTEADVEHQFVKSKIEIDETCAPSLFLNEAVEVTTQPSAS
ncbi:MAG: HlyD family efflux transporter periplasmic adaptor subunit [Rhodobacteraceae bacterium]|nr:HlyD family efflux transporter periplasmic adaptor subunit [Paracoccaceae bacterium]